MVLSYKKNLATSGKRIAVVYSVVWRKKWAVGEVKRGGMRYRKDPGSGGNVKRSRGMNIDNSELYVCSETRLAQCIESFQCEYLYNIYISIGI